MLTELKKLFLEHHSAQGFKIYGSFPLVIDDPTVLFTNATVTPFKAMFKAEMETHNYAMVQKCLRLGGASGSLDTARSNRDYTSVFEMIGSGLFDCDVDFATTYLADLLDALGLCKDHLIFTMLPGVGFDSGLLKSGFKSGQLIFGDADSKIRHQWSFGEGDLHGCGLTIWYARDGFSRYPARNVLNKTAECFELGRLVHIDGVMQNGFVQPLDHTAYDMGLGLSRIEKALRGTPEQSLESWRNLSRVLLDCVLELSESDTHYLANAYRVIEELVAEGVIPGSKKHAYILRKVVRSFIEELWVQSGSLADLSVVREQLVASSGMVAIASILEKEEGRLRELHEAASGRRRKYPEMNDEELRATFGIRQELLGLL